MTGLKTGLIYELNKWGGGLEKLGEAGSRVTSAEKHLSRAGEGNLWVTVWNVLNGIKTGCSPHAQKLDHGETKNNHKVSGTMKWIKWREELSRAAPCSEKHTKHLLLCFCPAKPKNSYSSFFSVCHIISSASSIQSIQWRDEAWPSVHICTCYVCPVMSKYHAVLRFIYSTWCRVLVLRSWLFESGFL